MLDKNRADNCKCQYKTLVRKIKRFVSKQIYIYSPFDSNYIWILGEEVVRRLREYDYEYLEIKEECILLHNIVVHVDYLQMFGDDMSIILMDSLTQHLD